jgi:hypothetical protein
MKSHSGSSAEEAIDILSKHPERFNTRDAFNELVGGLSVDTPGNVTLLYSGMISPHVSSNSLVVAVARQHKEVRIIDKTEAAKFLASDECINAVANIHNTTPKQVREDFSDPGNKFLFDGKEGLWAATSERFVQNTRTEVVTATPYARGDRVFAQIELREALNNNEIPSINGIPKDVFRQIYEMSGSLEDVNKAVAASSFDRMQGMQVAVINARVSAVDTAAFIDHPSPTLSTDQRANLKPLLDPAKETEFADWRGIIENARLKLQTADHKNDLFGTFEKNVSLTVTSTVAQSKDSGLRQLAGDGGAAKQATDFTEREAGRVSQAPAVNVKVKIIPEQEAAKIFAPQVSVNGKVDITLLSERYDLANAEKPAKSAATKSFQGTVLYVDKKNVYQLQENERGKPSIIQHDAALYKSPPLAGMTTKVDYLRGAGKVVDREQNLER